MFTPNCPCPWSMVQATEWPSILYRNIEHEPRTDSVVVLVSVPTLGSLQKVDCVCYWGPERGTVAVSSWQCAWYQPDLSWSVINTFWQLTLFSLLLNSDSVQWGLAIVLGPFFGRQIVSWTVVGDGFMCVVLQMVHGKCLQPAQIILRGANSTLDEMV